MDKKEIMIDVRALEYYRVNCIGSHEYFDDLCLVIADGISIWCGNTYVGQEKDPSIRDLFQDFYKNLAALVNVIKRNPESATEDELALAKSLTYTGDLYRYLGHPAPFECDKVVEPYYNDVYVSWSKELGDNYLLSKLYGPITLLHAVVEESDEALDLEGFSKFYLDRVKKHYLLARPNEHEVVFPTREKNIIKTDYLYDRCL